MDSTLRQRALTIACKPLTRRIVFGVGLFVVLYGAFGYFFLPGIIKSQAEQLIAGKLHRSMSIEKVEVSPYTLAVTVHGMKLMEQDGAAVFAAFDELKVDVSAETFYRFAPVVQELRLTKPYVHLVRTDTHHYNIDDIIDLILSQPASKEPARFSVQNIQVDGGRIDFEDRPEKTTHKVTDLKLGIPFVSSLPSQVAIFVEPLLSAKVNGAPLLIKGKARPFAEPKDAVADLDLEGVDLSRYMEYLPYPPRFKLPSAKLDLHLTANFLQPATDAGASTPETTSPGGSALRAPTAAGTGNMAPALVIKGTMVLRSLLATELNGEPILRLPELAVTLGNVNVFSGQYGIAKLVLTGPELNVVKAKDGTLNLMRLAPPSTAPTAAKRPVAAAGKDPGGVGIRLALDELAIKGGRLNYSDEQAARPMRVAVDKLDLGLRKIAVDLQKREATIVEVSSGSGNFLMLQGKLEAQAPPGARAAKADNADPGGRPDSPAAKKNVPASAAAPNFAVTIGKVAIADWSARLEDRSLPKPAVTLVAPLSLTLQDISTVPGRQGRLELQATVNKTGQIKVKGGIGMAPLHADLALDMKGVDILPLQPYVTDQVNLLVTRADLSAKGSLQLDQRGDGRLEGGYKGDMALGNVATVDKQSANDFLRWKTLYFGGMNARLAPLSLSIDQIALSDFFARVIVDPTGRINLQDIARNHPREQKSLTESGQEADGKEATKAAPAPVTAPPAPTAKMPPIKIRKLTLQGGKVRFSDNFIKPNYTANLMDLGGVVTGLSSDAATAATVDLRGQVNSAPLSISGRINPLKGDLFLDVVASVKGMELPPLSPYSGKYVGYGIKKGKLSFDVAYQVEKRKLTAQNRLILDQLTFGDKIDSPTATTLPVQLAVALLSDRNGVIDINLPVGGSLDDPQFSLGSIIVKVILNAITKAITAPFALLGSLFGGGEELSWLEFDPGSAAIPAAGEAKLKSLADALTDRPALKLEITGRTDPETDKEGLRRASIDHKLRLLKLKDLAARRESADAASVAVKPEEYGALLTRAYKDEPFPKPRNLVGLQKDLPVDEMEKLMLANAKVTDDDVTALGNQRAQTVKDWLVRNGSVSSDRIYIIASKSGAGGSEKAKPQRVDFSLR